MHFKYQIQVTSLSFSIDISNIKSPIFLSILIKFTRFLAQNSETIALDLPDRKMRKREIKTQKIIKAAKEKEPKASRGPEAMRALNCLRCR
jgi:hypothetical protein